MQSFVHLLRKHPLCRFLLSERELGLVLGFIVALPCLSRGAEDIAFFEREIRPVLVEHCYECHSTEKEFKGGLVLDSREGWAVGGDSGPAIVPGDVEGSLLIRSIRYTDHDFEMPPKTRLPAGTVAAFEKWVSIGAPDPREGEVVRASSGMSVEEGRKYWSYRPLSDPVPPTVTDTAWPAGEIDRFLLSRMETAGVSPAPQANPEALLRRLHLDLTGLPPAPDEITAFVANPSEEAWRLEVDRLLASPRFGERWGRHWLDLARFGESYTLRGLILREAWRYRDYVIDAFNRDLPFDQFIREQIAGDLMPATDALTERQRRFPATSFLALGNHNLEEQDKRQLDLDIVDEQLDTLGKAFLGQALGCARCHDHKFDPIPTRDYHAMAGILTSTVSLSHSNVSNWLDLPLPLDPEEEKAFDAKDLMLAALEADLKKAEKTREEAVAADPARASTARPEVVALSELPGTVIDDTAAEKVGDWKHSVHTRSYVGEGYLHDEAQGKGLKTISFVAAVPKAGRYEVRFAWATGVNRDRAVPVTISSADGDFLVHVDQSQEPLIEGRFVSLGQYRFEANGAGFVLVSNEGTKGYVVADAVQFLPVEAVEVAPETVTTNEESAVAKKRREAVAEVARVKKEIAAVRKDGPSRPRYLGVKEADTPADLAVLVRGVVHNPTGDPVPRGFLQVTSPAGFAGEPIPANQSGRLQLADWIASSDNPLTARVYVNRVWHWMFGRGLTRTTDNFGTTGEAPAQPELLDWLARRFINGDWSVKSLVREIALSRAYRLAAPADESPWAKVDPENHLFARAPRRRIEAESLRDSILVASGRLQLQGGGPTIQANKANDFSYEHDLLLRSVYLPALRNSMPEILETFNAADPSRTTGRRDIGTVAPQALFLLNNRFILEEARAAAARILTDGKTDEERLELASLRVLGRSPLPSEKQLASSLLASSPAGKEVEAWTTLFQAYFACIDFRYLE